MRASWTAHAYRRGLRPLHVRGGHRAVGGMARPVRAADKWLASDPRAGSAARASAGRVRWCVTRRLSSAVFPPSARSGWVRAASRAPVHALSHAQLLADSAPPKSGRVRGTAAREYPQRGGLAGLVEV